MKKILFVLLTFLNLSIYAQSNAEMRAVWLTNVDSPVLLSDVSIANAMDYLASINVNVVFPVVWNKGFTLYPSTVMDNLFSKPIWPTVAGRDPLKQVILEAHRNGIEVIPWFEFGFSSSYSENGGHLIAAYPSWAAKNVSGNLVVKNGFDWMAGTNPDVQNFLLSLMMETIDNYDVDGVQGDDRLPAMPIEGGYDSVTVAIYKSEHNDSLPPSSYTDLNWKKWRADKLTQYFQRMKDSVKSRGNYLILSVAPSPYSFGYDEYLQDAKTWMELGIPDNFIPQLYRQDLSSYTFELNKALNYVPVDKRDRFFAGVLAKSGSYVISPSFLLSSVQANRSKNVKGESFFFYEALRTNNNQLGDTLKKTYYSQRSLLTYRNGNDFRPKAEIVNENDADAVLSGIWQQVPVAGYKPFVYWTNDTLNYCSIEYSFNPRADAWYDLYAWMIPSVTFTSQARYVVYSNNDSTEIILNQRDQKNTRWIKLKSVYLTAGQKRVLKIDNTYLEGGKYLVADASMLMINRKLSPNVIITDVIEENEVENIVPEGFSLEQNYPNPFNPLTTIRYAIPLLGGARGGFVTLKVYDILGNEIEILVNEEKSPGTYEVTWNAVGLPSGVYFYQLRATPNGGEAGSFIETRKMVLLR